MSLVEINELKDLQNPERRLVDTDYLIEWYIKNKIAIDVPENKFRTTVLFTNPERSSQEIESELKSKDGNKYNLPIVAIEPVGFDIIKERNPHWLNDESLKYLNSIIYKPNGKIEYRNIRRPIPVGMVYNIRLICLNTIEKNFLEEQFTYHEGKYWFDDEGLRRRVTYSSFNRLDDVGDRNRERFVKSSTTINVSSHILPNLTSEDNNVSIAPAIKRISTSEKIISMI